MRHFIRGVEALDTDRDVSIAEEGVYLIQRYLDVKDPLGHAAFQTLMANQE